MSLFGFGNNKKTIVSAEKHAYSDCADSSMIRSCLRETFGSADLDAVLKVAKANKGLDCADPSMIRSCLRETFGTADLDAVFTRFMTLENKEKLEKKIEEPRIVKNKTTEYVR